MRTGMIESGFSGYLEVKFYKTLLWYTEWSICMDVFDLRYWCFWANLLQNNSNRQSTLIFTSMMTYFGASRVLILCGFMGMMDEKEEIRNCFTDLKNV